ncbi:ribonuclease P protein component [Methylobacterium sp. P5_C11]
MATIERLKKRPDFLAAAEGRRFHTDRMTAQGRLRTPQAEGTESPRGLRLGFTITKRVGHATERNRIRRRLRAALNVIAPELPSDVAVQPADIVLIARRPALHAPFDTLAADLRRAIPAVIRPSTGGRGERPPGRSGGRRSKDAPSQRAMGASPAQAPAAEGADIASSHPRVTDPRITGAARSDGAGSAPVATPNACGGVPDGQ